MAHENYLKHAEAEAYAKALAVSERASAGCENIVMLGSGGFNFAYAMASAGLMTSIIEPDAYNRERLNHYLNVIRQKTDDCGTLEIYDSYSALSDADMIIDARMPEEHRATHDDPKAHPHPHIPRFLLTSSPMIDDNQAANYDAVIHLARPLDHIKIMEISAYPDSLGSSLAATLALKLNKIPVLTPPMTGAITLRLLARYYDAADTIFMDGATPWDIDDAITEFGFALGPFEAEDITGLDQGFQLRSWYRQAYPGCRNIPLIDRMLELGKLGQKTGAGWYRYPGGGGKVEDPIVADLANEESYFAGNTRVDYSQDTIKDRLLLSVINDAFLMAEAHQLSGGQIDLITVLGFGFPRQHGGLISYADTFGAKEIIDKINQFKKEDQGASRLSDWSISPLIKKAADGGIPLLSLLSV